MRTLEYMAQRWATQYKRSAGLIAYRKSEIGMSTGNQLKVQWRDDVRDLLHKPGGYAFRLNTLYRLHGFTVPYSEDSRAAILARQNARQHHMMAPYANAKHQAYVIHTPLSR